ncbi:hypothetical protein GYMLUDRAFT_64055 [Collybiopsis luxurians FD-317 M1]|uniref:Uncharacterized protein n=1 Tax=Collybiopsis luxurians FD-317 M1 TaxID=944289 RepID=A0A0D0CCX4_9AGAR|nr:hypothetical protein GYMLUDRAFT_64055 [Collybiopsis luxurians FD-317 M1]
MSVENHTANLTAPVQSLSVEPSVQSLRDQFEEGRNMLLTVGEHLEKDRQYILELQNQMRQLLPIVECSTYLSLSVREDFKSEILRIEVRVFCCNSSRPNVNAFSTGGASPAENLYYLYIIKFQKNVLETVIWILFSFLLIHGALWAYYLL